MEVNGYDAHLSIIQVLTMSKVKNYKMKVTPRYFQIKISFIQMKDKI